MQSERMGALETSFKCAIQQRFVVELPDPYGHRDEHPRAKPREEVQALTEKCLR